MLAAGVTDMARCIEVINESFVLLGQGDYVMGGPTRNSHGHRVWFHPEPQFEGMPRGGPDQRFMSLPGYLGGRFRVCGNKWYGSNVNNPKKHGLPRSILTMTLNDAETARPLAILEANILSSMRTGAVVGLSARYLVPDNSKTMGVIAAGPISRYSTLAVARAIDSLQKITVFDINQQAAEKYCADMSDRLGLQVEAAGSFEEAVENKDIVVSAISGSHTPLFEQGLLKEGSLLSLPGRANVEEDYLLNAQIVPDCWAMQKTYKIEGLLMPEGEQVIPHMQLHNMVERGAIKESEIIDLGQIAAGRASIDKNSKRYKYFISNGLILQDIAWAMVLYENALKKNLGQELTLWNEPFSI